MPDIVLVEVTTVLDGGTFMVRVLSVTKQGSFAYGDKEKVRIANAEIAPAGSAPWKKAKERLQRKLLGKTIELEAGGRDREGNLLCRFRAGAEVSA